jgi:predicted DNA-binding antitoxin AbrB/MazE fold protein
MNNPANDNNRDNEKPAITLPAVVEKLVKSVDPSEPEKAQIAIHGADDLYKEIRIENTLEDADGEKVKLKPGAAIEVTIEAPANAVEKKSP